MSDSFSLRIRGQHSDDWENLFALLNTPEALLNSFELPYMTEEAFRERFGSPPPHTLIAETSLSSGRKRIIGVAWLTVLPQRRRHVGRLNLIVHAEYQGTDAEIALFEAVLDLADQWLGLRRIEIITYTDNTHGVELHQRYGFEIEATLRRYALRNGTYQDAYLMARLRIPVSSTQRKRKPRDEKKQPS